MEKVYEKRDHPPCGIGQGRTLGSDRITIPILSLYYPYSEDTDNYANINTKK